ncbi:MAG: hypothetical protein HZB26_18380 [Candidatus Hydrogenedentes bacterium]|nr:hypothetical protein [Candidatus Hydrogenedentota bacterium]
MSVHVPHRPEHLAMARQLLAETRAHDGLAPVDLEQFWADQEIATRDPFGPDIPQVPLGAILTGECVYDELGIEEDCRRYEEDAGWRLELNIAFNDLAERITANPGGSSNAPTTRTNSQPCSTESTRATFAPSSSRKDGTT